MMHKNLHYIFLIYEFGGLVGEQEVHGEECPFDLHLFSSENKLEMQLSLHLCTVHL